MKKIIAHILIVCIFMQILCSVLFNCVSYAEDNANNDSLKIKIEELSKADIVISKEITGMDFVNVKEDLISKLEEKGINKELINISSVMEKEENLETSFTWNKDMDESVGNITITEKGSKVEMIGNYSNPGKNAIYIVPQTNFSNEIEFDYNIDYGDSFNSAGLLVGLKRENGNLKGYMLSFNGEYGMEHNGWGTTNGTLWEIEWKLSNNTSSTITKTKIEDLNISTKGHLKVAIFDKQITIEGGDLTEKLIVNVDTYYGNGYGFFSNHYYHSCPSLGHFSLENIQVKSLKLKDLDEVLRSTTWNDNSKRFVVNVSDYLSDALSNGAKFSEVLSKIINNNAHYIGLGNSTNQFEMEKLISKNNNNGIFINNSNYSEAINSIAEYIKENITISTGENGISTVIANEDVNIYVSPSNKVTNTTDGTYPMGAWKVIHNKDYYENDEGEYEKNNQYTNTIMGYDASKIVNGDGINTANVIGAFTKTGKYTLSYKDVTVAEVYAHRKPVADFDINVSGTSVDLIDKSYDLDEQSNNNGISEVEWSYMITDETDWIYERLTTIDLAKNYVIKLRVKDHQEEWSDSVSKYITSEPVAPIANFKIVNKEIEKEETLEIVDESYDPRGSELIKYEWKIKDTNEKVMYTGDEILNDFSQYKAGTYYAVLVVTNSDNLESLECVQEFKINGDIQPPTISVTPDALTTDEFIDVTVSCTDDLSGFNWYKYAITFDDEKIINYGEEITENNSIISLTEYDKQIFIHIVASDNEGNVTEDNVFGPYYIQYIKPIANFNLVKNTITKYEELSIENNSSANGGSAITSELWTVKKYDEDNLEDVVVYTGSTPKVDFSDMDEGQYTISLVVTNEKGIASDEFSLQLLVTGESNKPVIVVDKQTEQSDKDIEIALTVTDEESGFKWYKYAVTEDENEPNEWSEEITNAQDTITITEKNKELFLHVIASDNAGNVTEDIVFGPYYINYIKPIAEFSLSKQTIKNSEELEVENNSSTNGGSAITSELWTIKKYGEDTVIYTGSTPKINYSDVDEGKYTISLVVTNEDGIASDEFSLDFDVIEEKFGEFSVKNVDYSDTNIIIPGVKFSVSNNKNSDIAEYVANENGLFNVKVPEDESEIIYTFSEFDEDNGYEKTAEFSIKVKFENDSMSLGLIESNECIVIEENSENGKLELVIKHVQKQTDIPAYKIKLINVDYDDSDIAIGGSTFEINIENQFGIYNLNKIEETTLDGIITFDKVNGYGNIAISITEKSMPKGYAVDLNVKKIQLNRSIDKGEITFVGSENISEEDVQINSRKRTITIYVKNKIEHKFLNFVFQQVDKNGEDVSGSGLVLEIKELNNSASSVKNKILNVNENIEDEEENDNKDGDKIAEDTYKTSDNGKIALKAVEKPETTGKIVYSVKVKQVPEGYILDDKEHIVEIEFEEINGIVEIMGVNTSDSDVVVTYDRDNSNERLVKLNFEVKLFQIESNKYDIDDLYCNRVYEKTSVVEFLNNLEIDGDIQVFDAKGNSVDITDSTKLVGTGFTVKLMNGTQSIEKTIIVVGDINGDGKITVADVSAISRAFVKLNELNVVQQKAADITGDSNFSISDVSKISRYFVKLVDMLF